MSLALATAESGCTYHTGSPATVTLSGVALSYCDTFSNSGLTNGALVDVHLAKSGTVFAVYAGATYATAGTLSLPTATKTLGSLTDGDLVDVIAVLVDPASARDLGELALATAGTALDLDGTTLNSPVMVAGFVSRTDTSLSFADNTFSLTKINDYRVWANSVAYDFTASETKAVPNATGFYYLYFDAAGLLQQSTSQWDIAGGGAPTATCYFNATHPTEYVLSDERHSYRRNPLAHQEAHLAIGAYWRSGLVGTFGDTNGSISITAGSYADEDIVLTFTGTTTQAKIVYRDASGWRVEALASDIRKKGANYIQYDNAGTLAEVSSNNNYVCYWVYATNEVTGAADAAGTIHVLVGQAQHTTSALALAASPDSLTLPPWIAAEGRLLYTIIYQRTAAVPFGDIYQTPTDRRQVKISGGVTLSGGFLSSALPAGQLYVGNATGQATAVTISGGVTVSDAGVATVSEDAFSFTDVTTANANTTRHGLLQKASAPASGLVNFLGIGNGQTTWSNKQLFDSVSPAALGTAAAGTSLIASRSDHVHQEWDGDIADINLDGGTDIGADLADADLILVDDGATGANRKSVLSRLWTYISGKLFANAPAANEFARFTDGDTLEGRTKAEAQTDLGIIGYQVSGFALVATTVVDASAYCFGHYADVPGASTATRSIPIYVSGTITSALVRAVCATAGSNESWTWSIRVNDTTNYDIAAVASTDTTREWSNTSLAIPVTAGDTITFYCTTPTWGTNPANMRLSGHCYIKPLST